MTRSTEKGFPLPGLLLAQLLKNQFTVYYVGCAKQLGGLIAARPKGVRTPIRTPKKHGVQPPHAPLERRAGAARQSPHAARHVHAYNRRAYGVQACRHDRQACRACTPVQRACKACKPFGQACRLCTPVGSRKPLNSRGLREPQYPYKCTRTLIRVLRYPYKGTRTLIRVLRYPYKGTRTLIRVLRYPYKGTRTLIRVLRYPYKGTRTLIRVLRYPYKGTRTLIRVLWYPYKGYFGTLIRVLWYPYKGTLVPL
ncbi:hypothetical protein PCANC_02976 [Puccinia coronata f. sp. avenae]|uniref:Uncharacterized protein n=1 Tax=Puccinia coronata f. sp. avenae TaxID=200324 RepID=A0A2N5W152_9BASI|nr:hypothetical protein PCANC_02976 [Puccinia coronata f. sp. avenae]